MKEKIEVWESPNCPSGGLSEIFRVAEKLRAAQHAPAVRIDHFLLAVVLCFHPSEASDILAVFAEVKDKWEAEL